MGNVKGKQHKQRNKSRFQYEVESNMKFDDEEGQVFFFY